jgi:hypothetical protein
MALPIILYYGGYHAVNQIFAKIAKPYKDKIWNVVCISDASKIRKLVDVVFTFVLVSYGWMIFYAPNMDFVVDVTKGYAHLGKPYIHQTTAFFFAIGLFILFIHDLKDEVCFVSNEHQSISITGHCINYLKYTLLVILIVWIGVLGGGQIIYF